jgi:hypothetical protein
MNVSKKSKNKNLYLINASAWIPRQVDRLAEGDRDQQSATNAIQQQCNTLATH